MNYTVTEVLGKDIKLKDIILIVDELGHTLEVETDADMLRHIHEGESDKTFLVKSPLEEREVKTVEIDFAGHVKARIKYSSNEIIVTDAMNGYGDAIENNKIIITKNS